ncbi:MAG: hypothetical protein CL927_10540 [Deltaproteobacteria bacterium]|nr:hypothetical protein [Deltaproteobacteria bacterium]
MVKNAPFLLLVRPGTTAIEDFLTIVWNFPSGHQSLDRATADRWRAGGIKQQAAGTPCWAGCTPGTRITRSHRSYPSSAGIASR